MRISDWSSDVCSSDLGQIVVAQGQGMAFAPACGTVHPAQFHARIAYVDQDFHGFACCGRTETSPTEMACSPSGVRSSNWPKVFTPQAMPACVMRPSSSTLIC